MVRQKNTGCVHRSYRGIHPSRNPITRINYRQTSFDLWLCFSKLKLWNERPVVVLFARELSYL